MARFYPLSVVDVRPETRDAAVLTLRPQPQDAAAFAFVPGQYLTFRRDFDGAEIRRAYSICAGRDEAVLQVGIKRVAGGCFSTWANDELAAGDVLEAMPPMGNFHAPAPPGGAGNYLLFAVGSGITPVLSLVKSKLAEELEATVTLVYGNRSVNAIMFREDLEDLKNRHMGRFSLIHVLSSEADVDLFSGRIDAEKCDALFRGWIDVGAVDTAFICGPESMMLAVSEALRRHGLEDRRIKFELFASAQPGRAPRRADAAGTRADAERCRASIVIDGTRREFDMPMQGQSILDAALAAELDAPFACKAGVCSTCRAMVTEGEVEMLANYALEDYEVRRGYVLTCQSHPLSAAVVVDYDR